MTAADSRSDTRFIARSVAQALANSDVRSALRDAMRDSRVTDHKLELAKYFSTAGADGVLSEMSRVAQQPTVDVHNVIGRLPNMDFYVPFKKHREHWRGTSDILVGYTFDLDSPSIEAFGTDGSVHTLYLTDAADGPPLIIIHPAEPKFAIIGNAQTSSGDVIEDRPLKISNIEEEPCQPNCGGGGGSGPLATGVYVTQFYSPRGDGWGGSLEMQFNSFVWYGYATFNPPWYYSSFCGAGTGSATLSSGVTHTGLTILVSPGVTNVAGAGCPGQSGTHGYGLYAVEIDGGLTFGNDDFGRRFFDGGTGALPFAATMNSFIDYYDLSGTPAAGPYQGTYSASIKLEYR
ncbi:MAG: hypothetical protein ABI852_05430 [Gemmatimonadaceae bacterium]